MAYASYRCLIDAPIQQVWQILKNATVLSTGGPLASWQQVIASVPEQRRGQLSESVDIDEAKQTIRLVLSNQEDIEAFRQFRLVYDTAVEQVALECILDWQPSSQSLQEYIQPRIEQFVREPILAIKQMVEQQAS